MIMKRQRDREILSDHVINKLIKFISKCRFNMGELSEQYMIYEKNFMDKVFLLFLYIYMFYKKITFINYFEFYLIGILKLLFYLMKFYKWLEKKRRFTCLTHEEIKK